jgi:nucleoid DNA-binding protein
MLIQNKTKRIIKRLAAKYDLPESEVIKIVYAGITLMKEKMKEGDGYNPETYKNTRIKGWGIFAVRPHRFKKEE